MDKQADCNLKKIELLRYIVPVVFLTVKFQNVKCAALIMQKAIKKGIYKLATKVKAWDVPSW